MFNHLRTREETRALFAAAFVGGSTGLLLGGAYLAGGMAQAAVQHDQVSRVASASEGALSEDALVRVASEMSPGALAVARRHDPFTVAGGAERDRQASLLAARLEQAHRPAPRRPLLLRASFGGPFNPAAAPFRFGGALDASRDLDCLTQAVYYEARGESLSGQAAVAQVVLNRVRHPAFPKSICGVVFQGAGGRSVCQFSFACDGSMRARREPAAWETAREIAARALNGAVVAAVGNATHFHTVEVSPQWGPRMMRVAQLGFHIFYRFGGRAGSAGAFTAEPEASSPEALTRSIYASGGLDTAAADGRAPVIFAASAMKPTQDSQSIGGGSSSTSVDMNSSLPDGGKTAETKAIDSQPHSGKSQPAV